MPLPSEPVTLTGERIAELDTKLADMRHDINNQLSLIMAAVELAHYRPEDQQRMMAAVVEQPPKIAAALTKFTKEFEHILGIKRP